MTEKKMVTKPATTQLIIEFGKNELDLIKKNICEKANDAEFNLFLYDCQSRGLNPLKNEIHWIKRGKKATHQTGIDGYRIIAQRTGDYQGQSDVEYGEMIDYKDDVMTDSIKVPSYAKIAVFRRGCKETPARAYWYEYVQIYDEWKQFQGRNQKTGRKYIGDMWKKMPHLMLAKCAEANALRKAFPEELGGLYTDVEMQKSDAEKARPNADVTVNANENEITPPPEPVKPPEMIQASTKKRLNAMITELSILRNYTPDEYNEALDRLFKGKTIDDLYETSAQNLISVFTQLIKTEKLKGKKDEAVDGDIVETKDLDKPKSEIENLEFELKSEINQYETALEHPTDTYQFRNAQEKQLERISNMKRKIQQIKNGVAPVKKSTTSSTNAFYGDTPMPQSQS